MKLPHLPHLIRQHVAIDETFLPGSQSWPRHHRLLVSIGVCGLATLVIGSMVTWSFLSSGSVSKSDLASSAGDITCSDSQTGKPVSYPAASSDLQSSSQNLRQAWSQYKKSVALDKTKLKANVQAVAMARRQQLQQLITSDPAAAWQQFQTDSKSGGWNGFSSDCAEQPVSIQGSLKLIRNSQGVVLFQLTDSQGNSSEFTPANQSGRALLSGQKVTVNGMKLGKQVVTDASSDKNLTISAQPTANFKPDRVIVRFKHGTSTADQQKILTAAGTSNGSPVDHQGAERLMVAKGQVLASIGKLQSDAQVEYAEPDYAGKIGGTPNDPQVSSQWYLNNIKASTAWDTTQGSANAVIGVVDTGVDGTHPDLAGRVIKSANFTTEADATDNNGHGTNVAGIASAITNNGVGVAGVAYNANLLSAKVMDTSGNGYYSDMANGIDWAVDNGAKVINASFYGTDASVTLQDAINYAWSHGVVVVACAGNDNTSDQRYPAAYEPAIAVGATTSADAKTSYSNFGPWVDVAAPGGESSQAILSTCVNASYCSYFGTSQATPQVAGEASLLIALHPDWGVDQVKRQIESTTDAVGGTGTNWTYGRINLAKAVQSPPDLVVKSIQLTDKNGMVKSSFAINEPIYAKVTVANQIGVASAPKAVTQIYTNAASDQAVGSASDIGMSITHGVFGANGSYWYGSWPNGQYNSAFSSTKSWTEATAGAYTARAFINFDDSVSETNYANNQATVSYTITAASPTPTPTPTPVTSQLLKNPGFESGNNGNWTNSSVIGQWSNFPAHAGSWYAWLGGGNSMTDYLGQTVSLPSIASKITVGYYLLISTGETTTTTKYDTMTVQLKDSSGNVLTTLATYSNLDKLTSYTNKTFDISSYKGKSAQLYLKATTDSSLPTSFVVDDITINSTN